MIKSVNHIGVAVKDLDAGIEIFRKLFQFKFVHREKVLQQKVNVASFEVGDVKIELISPTSDSSPIAKFIEKRGEGIHHIGFETGDLVKELDRLKDEGMNIVNDRPQDGAHDMLIAFLHPKFTMGVLTELCQKKK